MSRREIAELEKLHRELVAKNEVYWAKQVEIQHLAASAWASHAEGKEEALSLMRSAAEEEDGTEKNAITPGPMKPAREQLGELLLRGKGDSLRSLSEIDFLERRINHLQRLSCL